jgi:hypothetical protein
VKNTKFYTVILSALSIFVLQGCLAAQLIPGALAGGSVYAETKKDDECAALDAKLSKSKKTLSKAEERKIYRDNGCDAYYSQWIK